MNRDGTGGALLPYLWGAYLFEHSTSLSAMLSYISNIYSISFGNWGRASSPKNTIGGLIGPLQCILLMGILLNFKNNS